MIVSDHTKFLADGAEFSDNLVEMYALVGCHKACSKRFMAGHDARSDEGVHVNASIKKFFPEKKSFFLVADQHSDESRPRWHKRKSGFEQRLANLISI